MSRLKKRINVQLESVIKDEGLEEVHRIFGKGEILSKGPITAITFIEKTKDEGDVQHFISIYPDRINIKRKGQVETNQQFRLNKKTENKLELASGNILIDIFTKKIDYDHKPETSEGRLRIIYEALLNGQMKRKHELTLFYNKEDIE